MPSRRAFVAGALATTLPLHAARPTPPKVGAVRWPGPGHDIHGYLAIPAQAHGAQSAVLVLPGRSGADRFTLAQCDSLALTGFVACIPKTVASLDDAVATVNWLATNAYATGKVAAIGDSWSGGIIERIATTAAASLTCGVIFGSGEPVTSSIPILTLPPLMAATDPSIYAASWQQALTFLSMHLLPHLSGRDQRLRQRAASRKMRGPSNR